jgi:hypothetical protein
MDCMLVIMGSTGHNGWMDGEYGEKLGGEVGQRVDGSFCLGTMEDNELFFVVDFFLVEDYEMQWIV